MNMSDNELQHHGIKGQRWGVRRTKAQLARARGKSPKVSKEDAIASGDPKKIKPWRDKLSDDELRKALGRVDLNQRLADADRRSSANGKKVVGSALNALKGVATAAATLTATYAIVAKVNNTFNTKRIPELNGTYYKNQGK